MDNSIVAITISKTALSISTCPEYFDMHMLPVVLITCHSDVCHVTLRPRLHYDATAKHSVKNLLRF
jgi:hypothetical protein